MRELNDHLRPIVSDSHHNNPMHVAVIETEGAASVWIENFKGNECTEFFMAAQGCTITKELNGSYLFNADLSETIYFNLIDPMFELAGMVQAETFKSEYYSGNLDAWDDDDEDHSAD